MRRGRGMVRRPAGEPAVGARCLRRRAAAIRCAAAGAATVVRAIARVGERRLSLSPARFGAASQLQGSPLAAAAPPPLGALATPSSRSAALGGEVNASGREKEASSPRQRQPLGTSRRTSSRRQPISPDLLSSSSVAASSSAQPPMARLLDDRAWRPHMQLGKVVPKAASSKGVRPQLLRVRIP
jgi:hypothetical protein